MSKTKQSTLLQSWSKKTCNQSKPVNSRLFNCLENSSNSKSKASNQNDIIVINDFSDEDDILLASVNDDEQSNSSGPKLLPFKQINEKRVSKQRDQHRQSFLKVDKCSASHLYAYEELNTNNIDLSEFNNEDDDLFLDNNDNAVINYPDSVPGFDSNAGRLWIYPTNFPLRDYQYNIVQQSLFKNTLVVLPTGLGKTFIASVVMYNYYRWYPIGKIVFMAPTKPLVAQQIEACYKVMGIPQTDMVEMTGMCYIFVCT